MFLHALSKSTLKKWGCSSRFQSHPSYPYINIVIRWHKVSQNSFEDDKFSISDKLKTTSVNFMVFSGTKKLCLCTRKSSERD